MSRPFTRSSRSARARLVVAVLMAAAGLAVGPTAQVAAAPTARVAAAPGMNAPKAAPAYEAVCGPVPAPIARCASLRRTDIAAVPAMAPGTAADAIGTPLASVSGYGPADLRSAYNLPSSGGSGRTVAIVDAYDLPTAASDLAVYRAQFGLPACTTASGCFRKVNQRGGTTYPAFNGGWAGEIELDLDMVSATCPGCKILLVEADTANLSDLGAAVDMAVKLGAVAVSNSYGAPEWGTESAMDPHYNHPGVAITASTGDWGYQYGVEYPAASAYVMSVGGTSLELAANARGWTETVWATSSAFATGSGCSLYEPKPYWQTDPDCANRIAADVSAVADPDTGVAVYDRNGGGWTIYGGTSTSAPIIAATYALAGQPAAGSYPGRLLYDSAASLWDVTAGSNGPCDGDPSYFCQAAVGYDGPTGLGTPNGSSAFVPDILDLGAGTRTSCALTSAGKLSCWGFGSAGEASAPAGTYVALSTGDSHSCAIDTAGALHCWGDDSFGQSTPPAGSYRTVSGGGVNSCAIGSDSTLRCWGDTSHGVASPPSGTYTAVSVGLYHACAVNTSAGLRCWGDNSHGQASAPTGTYIAVAAGQYHTCALAGSGAISCWGDNSHGQLNHPAGSYLDLDAGSSGACAVKLDGSLSCWGDNSSGQNSPPGALASRVALGTTHGCAYFATAIECWGGNADGEGIPLFATTSLPVAGSGYPYATDITLSSAVVPTPTFSVTGSLPSGISLSSTGHLAGTSSTPGSYPFSVTASNGIAPAATQALTLVVDASPVPGVPTSVAVIASDTTAVVTWAAPIPNGGSTITGYTVSSSPPATGCVITLPAALTCSFSGLTNHSPYTFSVTATNAEGTGPAASATATPLFGATYVPVTPNRLVDSRLDSHSGKRLGLGASLHAGTSAEFVVINRSGDPHLNIPASAIAVTGNLTVTNQGSSGFLALTPDNPGGMPGTSTLNFPRGDNRANAVTVALSPTGTLWVTYVGAPGTMADAIFDVTGYFVANSSGSTYVSLTPNRLVDSRLDPHSGKRLGLGASLHVGSPAWFTVVDQKPSDPTQNVPANATAVTGNLTVTNQSSSGFLALTPTKPSGTPTTSTLNFPKGDNRANAVTVPLSGGKLWVTLVGKSGSTADVIFDVTGYFVADASGATYVALTPNRLVDSRLDPHSGKRLGLGASLTSGTAAEFTAVDRSLDPRLNVPSGSVAVTGNLTVTNQGSSGFLALTPEDPRGMPATSTLNFPKGDNRANAVTVALSPTGTLWVTFISKGGTLTDVIFDVTGYFAP